MRHYYLLLTLTLFTLSTLLINLNGQSTVTFSLDACAANFGAGEQFDFSEFTADIDSSGGCADLAVVGGHLYRENPEVNAHSCTPGFDGNAAMCIGSDSDCSFTAGSDKALRFDILVTPGPGGEGSLSSLSFYERAPEEYVWLNGGMGPNNYPTRFAVRVLKNDEEIFLQLGIPTELDWNLNTFDFTGNSEFSVTEPTVFNFELTGYCPVFNGATVSAWDVDEIVISADCCTTADGGTLSGGPFSFCVGDTVPDMVSGVTLSGESGDNSQYIVTDEDGNILSLPDSPEEINFDGAGEGICLIWHLSYDGSISGLEMGNNIQTDLQGDCFDLSNPITVERFSAPEGGALVGGPFEFCVGDSIPDFVSGVILAGATGENSQYIVTDTSNVVLSLPAAPDSVNFDGAGSGICLIWHLSYNGSISGLEIGSTLPGDLEGCFDLSNPVMVTRNEKPEAGELTGGPFEFCVGDGVEDHVSGVTLTGNTGDNSQYVITDADNFILGMPDDIEDADFDDAGPGNCLIWHLAYNGDISGLAVGNNLFTDVDACMDLSNAIVVVRNHPDGGELTGGPFEFCVGDTIPDYVTGVELVGNVGPESQYVVTDTSNTILNLPNSTDSLDFNNAGAGICLIWHVSYFGDITGLEVDSNLVTGLGGCFDLSNPIEVVRLEQPCDDSLGGGPNIDVVVMPNPVYERIQMEFSRETETFFRVDIFDMFGRHYFQKEYEKPVKETIDVSNLPEGHYFMRIDSPEGRVVKNFVVLRR